MQKLPFLSPNFLVAQNIPIQHTISGRDLQRGARAHTGFGDPSNSIQSDDFPENTQKRKDLII